MATHPTATQNLSYDENDDVFIWKGAFEELKTIVNTILDDGNEVNGEVMEDKKHNAKTYKVGENSVRFYTSTSKLKLFGANYATLRDGLMDLLTKQNSQPPTKPSCSSTTQSAETPDSTVTLRSLHDELAKLRSEVVFIKTQLPSRTSTDPPYEELQEELRVSREELAELKAKMNIQNDNLCKIKNERDSLLTAISLLVSDNKEVKETAINSCDPAQESQRTNDNTTGTEWQTVRRKERPQSKPKTKQSTNASTPGKSTTTMIVGDSIVSKLEGWKMADKHNRVIINSFPGATADDMTDHIKPVIRRKPNKIILHVGTNNLEKDEVNVVTDKIVNVCQLIEQELPECEIAISELTPRNDSPALESNRKEVNKSLKAFCRTRDWSVISHNNISETGLNSRGLHLNRRGISTLARDFNTFIREKH